MGDTDVDFFLETLKQLIMSSKIESITREKRELESLEKEIKYMREFLKVTEKKRKEHSELMNLVRRIKDVVSEAENIIELFVLDAFDPYHAPHFLRQHQDYFSVGLKSFKKVIRARQNHLSLELKSVKKEIKTLMAKLKKIYDENKYDINIGLAGKKLDHSFFKSEGGSSSSGGSNTSKISSASAQGREPPPMGFLKIKFDGAFDVTTHKGGNGLVIRDIEGRPKGMRAQTADPMVEALGFREAAKWGRDRVDANYILKGDSSSSGGSNTSKVAEEKVVVGFKEEVVTLLGKLYDSGDGRQLEIISIIGAAGGGKTTLAREVYEHPSTSDAFDIRAWINVSQDYDETMKRNFLIHILEVASPEEKRRRDYENSSDNKLGEDTLKCLKSKKYLIVMDDIWGIEAWNDIQRSLPRESNGSKVVFTSRLRVEPNSIHCVPHCLAPLPKSHSWELLQKKVFGKKGCPQELVGIGEQIVVKCEGLPLAIIAIAGILAGEEKTLGKWEEVSKHLSSIIAKNQDNCMEILELSYNHLPLHLKACFVYIGGFPEDSEILVRELIWLWIAEGFIQQREGNNSLEDVAEDYLNSLFDRSLVMVSRKKSLGGIKACRIHDLLRELCLKKAEEDNFLVPIYADDTFSPYAATKHRRLFIGSHLFPEFSLWPCTQNVRSFLCLRFQNTADFAFEYSNLSFFVKNFELLRVLSFISSECPGEIGRGHLVHLRYLAFELPNRTMSEILRWPFSCLLNLETLSLHTLNISVRKTLMLPHDIFNMAKLRHLYAKGMVFKYHLSFDRLFKYHLSCLYPFSYEAARIDFYRSPKLDSLQTLYPICPCEKCQSFLVKTPNLRKLGFYGELISSGVLMLPDLEFLKCLETLKFYQSRTPYRAITLSPVLKFPPTMTRLTLKNTWLNWEDLSIIQTLPSLEVLKLSNYACQGRIWNASELEFSRLKYLRLRRLEITEWKASEDQFPRLEVLVLKNCIDLKRIPIDFANLNDLREIEVWRSSCSAEESAREIQEERRDARGDDGCINLLFEHNWF